MLRRIVAIMITEKATSFALKTVPRSRNERGLDRR